MKKVLLIFLIVLSIFVFGCFKDTKTNDPNNNQNNNNNNNNTSDPGTDPGNDPGKDPLVVKTNVNFSIADFTLENSDDKDYICFNVIVNSEEDVNVKFDITYAFTLGDSMTSGDSLATVTLSQVDTFVRKGTNLLDYQIELDESKYDKYVYISVNNISEEYNCIDTLDDCIEKSVISIALNVLSKDANNEIAKKIDDKVNAIEVSSIEMSIDYENKKVQALGSGYVLDANFGTDYIVVEITFSSKAHLTTDFDKLVVKNGIVIAKGVLYIENNKYYYKEEVEKTSNELSSITLTFDYLKHSDEVHTDEYDALMSNPEYNKITITITLKDGFTYSNSLVLNINDKNIDSSKYKIEGNVLTYVFDDPNWTGFY